ncbi:hypothetical protein [Bradyrhizobium phage BDU-MI-1]|nr:hypothetical protein [Bradyrhizobium phage BDU-MI-1]
MARPWNAIIAASEAIGQTYMQAFGLSPEIWEIIRHDASTMGKRFERVVVIRPHWQMDAYEHEMFERQLREQWHTLVSVTGSLNVI